MLYGGQQGFLDLEYYNPVPTLPRPNNDLDLQIIWFRCMQRHGASLDSQGRH